MVEYNHCLDAQIVNSDYWIQNDFKPSLSLLSPSFVSQTTSTNDSMTTTTTINEPCLSSNIYNFPIIHSDAFEIARQKKFNLTIPTEAEESNKKFRLRRKSFAIVCCTNMTSKMRFLFFFLDE